MMKKGLSTSMSTAGPAFRRGELSVIHEPQELTAITHALRHVGTRVVLVPTMGALHAGHIQLVRQAKSVLGATVVVSIFVNPLQFGAGEDLDAYPRTLDADVELLRAEGVELVFAPSPAQMYPEGPGTTIHPGEKGQILEGEYRPTHFAGVLTVVAKLFNIVRPHAAFFGEKDYQQLTLINEMVKDLNLDVEVVGVPTVREPDGLALSSRNRYLSAEERQLAVTLSAALTAGSHTGTEGPEKVLEIAQAVLAEQQDIAVDYLALTDRQLGPAPEQGEGRLLVAARIGSTRLIDNVGVHLGEWEDEDQPQG